MRIERQLEARLLDEVYGPVVFEEGSGNIEATILQRTERFFSRIKREVSINHLANVSAEAAGGWTEEIDIVALGQPGQKPMRLITELRYYEDTVVASVVQDHRDDGSIAVSFNHHVPSNAQRKAMFQGIEPVDTIITQDSF